jgi:SAM-dependent methyltransferase
MVHDLKHGMLPDMTADEMARQGFVLALKQYISATIRPGNDTIYQREIEPAYKRSHGGASPSDREEIKSLLLSNDKYQTWCSLNRASQEMMWDAVSAPIFRDRAAMERRARDLRMSNTRKGSLTLDPDFEAPFDVTCVDVHCQPGGYAQNVSDDDIIAGALYEAGGNIYSMGRGASPKDSKAMGAIAHIARMRPGWRPKRVLDMGCSAGASSVPYALEYPNAEVYAIDVGEAMLRYAHARAEALGAAVHFHLADAGATKFPGGFFDLIVSHNMFHEISNETRRRVMKESWRLLAPGGLCIHQDVPIQNRTRTPYQQAERAYDVRFNGEPWWENYADADCAQDMIDGGFPAALVREDPIARVDTKGAWFAVVGEKPAN